MSEKNQVESEPSDDDARMKLSLALMAVDDIGGAELLAAEKNVPFDRNVCFSQIVELFGSDAAAGAQARWSKYDQEMEASYQRCRMGLERGLHLAAMDRTLERFTQAWRWSADQLKSLLDPFDAAGSNTPALIGQLRGSVAIDAAQPIAPDP